LSARIDKLSLINDEEDEQEDEAEADEADEADEAEEEEEQQLRAFLNSISRICESSLRNRTKPCS
jgi:hypothetical protein